MGEWLDIEEIEEIEANEEEFLNENYMSDTTHMMMRSFLLNLSINSQKTYRQAIEEVCRFTCKDFRLISEEDAYMYYKELMRKLELKQIKKTTIRPKLVILNRFALFIQENFDDEFTNVFKDLDMPSVEEKVDAERIPSWEELDAVLAAARAYSDTLFLICVMVAKMGIIPTKLLQLKRSDLFLDAEQPYIHIVGAYRKNGNHIVLPADIHEMLTKYLDTMVIGPDDVLFYNSKGKPLTLRVLDWQLEKAQSIAGVEHPYTLRSIKSVAVVSMLSSGVALGDVCDYTGLSARRAALYTKVYNKPCPADLTHIYYK